MTAGSGASGALEGLTVLVVEDELIIGLDLKAQLTAAGATVSGPYATIKSALAAASDGAFSVALLDVRLGRESTLDVADALANRGVPVVFYSGQGLEGDMEVRFSSCPMIHKPALGSTILAAVAASAARGPAA